MEHARGAGRRRARAQGRTEGGQCVEPDAPIFEPFLTTQEGGTGLGPAIVHRIVADHGGRVEVESRPGRTTFTVAPAGTARATSS